MNLTCNCIINYIKAVALDIILSSHRNMLMITERQHLVIDDARDWRTKNMVHVVWAARHLEAQFDLSGSLSAEMGWRVPAKIQKIILQD